MAQKLYTGFDKKELRLNPEVKDLFGRKPIDIAMKYKRAEIIEVLIFLNFDYLMRVSSISQKNVKKSKCKEALIILPLF